MKHVLILFLVWHSVNGQFAEIASLATSLLGSGLGPALGGTAAAGSAAGGALSQIGQLYQLAQTALQLTGTGVGVLNQASEGNWFPAVLEHASKNTRMLMGGQGGFSGPPNLGPLGPGLVSPASRGSQIGPEFGTGFPAPTVEDYNDSAEEKEVVKTTETLVDIDDGDDNSFEVDTTTSKTITSQITLFPKEDETNSVTERSTSLPLKAIRIELPETTRSSTDVDYIEEVTSSAGSHSETTDKSNKNDGDENLLTPERELAAKSLNAKTGRTEVPNLSNLIDVLRKSRLKESEIMEIVSQVEGNENTVKPPKIDFTSAVQNIPLKKLENRERIAKASRELRNNVQENIHPTYYSQLPDLVSSSLATTPYTTTQFTQVVHPVDAHQIPPFTQPEFLSSNRLQREISSVPIEKTPYSTVTPPLANLLPQQPYTTTAIYDIFNHWRQPILNLQPNAQQLPLYPSHPIIQPSHYTPTHYQNIHSPSPQLTTLLPQHYQVLQPTYSQQVQNSQQPLQQTSQVQQLQQPQQQKFYEVSQEAHPFLYQQHFYNTQHQVAPPQQYIYQQQPQQHTYQQPQQPQHLSQQQQFHLSSGYRQLKQVTGDTYIQPTNNVIFSNQPSGITDNLSRTTYQAQSPPKPRVHSSQTDSSRASTGNSQVKSYVHQRSVKTQGIGYTSHRAKPMVDSFTGATSNNNKPSQQPNVNEQTHESSATVLPRRRYPIRIIKTQWLTTPPPVRTIEADAKLLLH